MIFARGAGRRAAGNRMRRFDAVSALSWFSAGMLLAGCSAPAVQSGARQRTNMNSQCVGRFGFQAPDKLTVGGRSQSIYRVDVSTEPIPPEGASSAWEQRLKAIRALPAPAGRRDPILRTFELAPGVAAAWYAGRPSSADEILLEAAKPAGNRIFRAVRVGAPGKEAPAETLVRDIVASYAPGAGDYGFCLGAGSVTIEASQNESARIVLQDARTSLEIRLETQTVSRPQTESYADLDEEKSYAQASGAALTVLREAPRGAAGLEGKEIRIRVTPPGEPPLLRFTWHFDGVPRNASQPAVNIVGHASPEHQADLEQAWDTILQSLHPLPVARR